jgi:hypothetical protein
MNEGLYFCSSIAGQRSGNVHSSLSLCLAFQQTFFSVKTENEDRLRRKHLQGQDVVAVGQNFAPVCRRGLGAVAGAGRKISKDKIHFKIYIKRFTNLTLLNFNLIGFKKQILEVHCDNVYTCKCLVQLKETEINFGQF